VTSTVKPSTELSPDCVKSTARTAVSAVVIVAEVSTHAVARMSLAVGVVCSNTVTLNSIEGTAELFHDTSMIHIESPVE